MDKWICNGKRGGEITMLKSTKKLIKLLKSLPKVEINDNEKFMEGLWKKIRRQDGRNG